MTYINCEGNKFNGSISYNDGVFNGVFVWDESLNDLYQRNESKMTLKYEINNKIEEIKTFSNYDTCDKNYMISQWNKIIDMFNCENKITFKQLGYFDKDFDVKQEFINDVKKLIDKYNLSDYGIKITFEK